MIRVKVGSAGVEIPEIAISGSNSEAPTRSGG